MTATNFK